MMNRITTVLVEKKFVENELMFSHYQRLTVYIISRQVYNGGRGFCWSVEERCGLCKCGKRAHCYFVGVLDTPDRNNLLNVDGQDEQPRAGPFLSVFFDFINFYI